MGQIILGIAAALLGLLSLAIALTPGPPVDWPTTARTAYRVTGFAVPVLFFAIAARLIFGG